jgi:hypothetical protein
MPSITIHFLLNLLGLYLFVTIAVAHDNKFELKSMAPFVARY